MSEQPLIINRVTKKFEKATGLEEYTMDMSTIFSEESVRIVIENYFATQPTGEQEWITDEIEVGEDNLTIKFTNLYSDGERLPLKIIDAKVAIWAINNDSDAFIHSGNTTERDFIVSRKTGRVEDKVKIQFIIRGMIEE